jgi:murein tripeptide amidase MpaA
MKQVKSTIVFLLLATVFSASAQQYSTVKIVAPQDKLQRANLLGLLEIDHFDMQDGAIIAEIDQQQLAALRSTTYQYEVLVADVAAHLQELNRQYFTASPQGRAAMEQPGGVISNLIPTPSAFQVQATLGGFYSFAQMNTAMNNLVAAYPAIAQKTSLGLSTEGRNIWCIKISDNVATDETNEPEVLYIGLQHAREAIGGSSMIFFMQYLCEQYVVDPRIQALVNNREIYIIPCMNPDGWEYNRINDPNGGGGWRKNRRNNGDGTFGVDLNRNWSTDWANCSGASSSCGSGSTSSDVYWGPSAFSEPETNAVRNFVTSHHIVSCNDQHSFGPYYSLPFGRPTLHTGPDTLSFSEQQFYSSIPAMMGKHNGMRAGNSLQSVGYEVAGGVKDWMLKGDIGTGTKEIVMGFTGEGGAGGGTGGAYGSFWPPASQIINLSKGMVFQNLQLAFAAGSYVDITDRSDIAVSAATGSFNFRVKRIGLENSPVTVSLLPIENIISAGSPVTVNTLDNYADIYDGSINYTLHGNIQAGYRIKYAWRVQTGGQTYYDTVIKFYNPVELFYEDMEAASAAAKWTVSANWNYTSAIAFAGSKSLTESPLGLYGANRNDIIRYNGTFDLSNATAAYLTFWVRHRAENFRDKMQVQISNNGTTWTPVAGKTTVQEPGTLDGSTINGEPALTGIREDWTPEMFDLSAFLGDPAVQLRFVFTSDANTTGYDFQVDDGFNIDELKMIKSTTALITLPTRFINLTGQLKPNNTIKLNWETAADSDHDYFVIEKSSDGISFSETGRTAGQQLSFIDINPFNGNNYYRVKAVDRNGQFSYSRVINISYKPVELLMTFYPNPVSNELNLRVKTFNPDNITICITDITGQIFYNQRVFANEINRDIRINTGSWPAKLYIIKAVNSKNEVLATEKFVRH